MTLTDQGGGKRRLIGIVTLIYGRQHYLIALYITGSGSVPALSDHKFKIGQTVFLRGSLNVPGGAYVVTKQLPERAPPSRMSVWFASMSLALLRHRNRPGFLKTKAPL